MNRETQTNPATAETLLSSTIIGIVYQVRNLFWTGMCLKYAISHHFYGNQS
jgi:hypothetical protein